MVIGRIAFLLGASLLALGSVGTAQEPLSGPELNKVGTAARAAMALVELKDERRAYGSAFCIHPGGVFLTSGHAARGVTSLILNPGQKDERVYKATVLRTDPVLDLAILQVDGVKDLSVLGLGTEEKLGDRGELVAAGFTVGEIFAPGQKVEPRLSFHIGRAEVPRRADGAPPRFQIEEALYAGNSGGPVLDRTGKVVGMIVGRVQGGGGLAALPVGAVARFTSQPVIAFDPPRLEAATVRKPVAFEARVRSVLPDPTPFEVQFGLKPPRGVERTFAMKPDAAGKFTATVVPMPPTMPEPEYRLLARFENGQLDATTADRTFRVGAREVKLGDVSRVRFGAAPEAVLSDGETVRGPVAGLGAVPVRLGGQSVPVALDKAAEVRFAPAVESDLLWYTLVVRQGEKEILRQSEGVRVHGVLPPPAAGPGHGGIKAPPLAEEKTVRELDGPAADVAVGGGGRYLVLHLPKARRLAVFDANKADFIGSIPAEDDVKFAAGLVDVLVARPRQGILERWTLEPLARDVAVPMPVKGVVLDLAMGSGSRGPLLVRSATGDGDQDPASYTLVDTETLKARGPDNLRVTRFDRRRHAMQFRASADGKVFALWCTNQSPQGIGMLVTSDMDAQFHYTNASAGHLVPGPDGQALFTAEGKIPRPPYDGVVRPDPSGPVLPASHGDAFLKMQPPGKDGPVTVHRPDRAEPVATVMEPAFAVPRDGVTRGGLPYDKRVFLIPDARLLVVIPTSADRLILHRLAE